MSWSDLVSWITGDLTPEEGTVFRKAGFLILWRVSFMVFVGFSFGWFDFFGVPGFARDTRIEGRNSAQMIQYNTGRIDELLTEWKIQNTRILRVTLVDMQLHKCHAPKEETKAIYREQMGEAQERYRHFTGSYFEIPSCADL